MRSRELEWLEHQAKRGRFTEFRSESAAGFGGAFSYNAARTTARVVQRQHGGCGVAVESGASGSGSGNGFVFGSAHQALRSPLSANSTRGQFLTS